MFVSTQRMTTRRPGGAEQSESVRPHVQDILKMFREEGSISAPSVLQNSKSLADAARAETNSGFRPDAKERGKAGKQVSKTCSHILLETLTWDWYTPENH